MSWLILVYTKLQILMIKTAVDKMTANLSVMFYTPLRHPIQQLVRLVNDQVRTLLITTHSVNTQVTDRHLTK